MKGIDLERIKEISKKIISLKENKIYPFNKENLFPDAILPGKMRRGGKKHALFLLHAISTDSMSRATGVYDNMRKISEFLDGNLNALAKISKEEIYDNIGKGSIFDPAEVLIENAKMIKHYDNDPRKLKQGSLEATIKEIMKFKQYAEGKASLLVKNFVRFGMWDYSESEIPIKIDRHVMRISLSYGVIDTEIYGRSLKPKEITSTKLNEAIYNFIGEIKIINQKDLLKPLKEAYLNITKTENLSAIALDDALWAMGAKLCNKNNYSTCEKECPLKCPKRYSSDHQANWFFLDTDNRKNKSQILIPFKEFYVGDILK